MDLIAKCIPTVYEIRSVTTFTRKPVNCGGLTIRWMAWEMTYHPVRSIARQKRDNTLVIPGMAVAPLGPTRIQARKKLLLLVLPQLEKTEKGRGGEEGRTRGGAGL